jgi:hypothetical protein
MHLVREDKLDNQNIDGEKQDGDQDFGIVPGHIHGERYENTANEEEELIQSKRGSPRR